MPILSLVEGGKQIGLELVLVAILPALDVVDKLLEGALQVKGGKGIVRRRVTEVSRC